MEGFFIVGLVLAVILAAREIRRSFHRFTGQQGFIFTPRYMDAVPFKGETPEQALLRNLQDINSLKEEIVKRLGLMKDQPSGKALEAAGADMNTIFKAEMDSYIRLTKLIDELGKQHPI